MNRFLVLTAVLMLVVAILGCQSDIILPEDRPLKGTYEGVYSYTTDFRNPIKEVIVKAHVTFIFDETAYHMNMDTFVDSAVAFEFEQCFCAVDGQYALTEGVRLKEDVRGSNPEEGCEGACNEELNPEGTFIKETKGDSLILKYQESGTTTLQMLRLLKISD